MNKKNTTAEIDLFADFADVNSGNILVGAVKRAAENGQNQEPMKKIQRIEDFGEKKYLTNFDLRCL